MFRRSLFLSALATAVCLAAMPASASEVRVMISGGMTAAYKELVRTFEARTGNVVVTAYGPSMGTTENAIPVRLARGERADVLIMVGEALEGLEKNGVADAATHVDLVRSPIGMSVRAGAAKPDISTVDALRATLLRAGSVVYSDSASGVYVERKLFARLGIEAEMRGKARMIPAEPVAMVVARGEAELGFQQVSELLPIAGADFVAKLPDDVQKITVFSAGLTRNAAEPAAGRALIAFIASNDAAPVLLRSGLEPIAHR